MNFLIFGGSGFIGSHLNDHINDKNVGDYNIYNYDIQNKRGNGYENLNICEPVNININNLSNSVIYNLAAVHVTPGHPNHEYFETNIRGSENICNFARSSKINTIVFTSSIAPYGASEDLKLEDTIPMPTSPYGISKLTAEYIHKVWQAEDPLNRKLIIVRPGVVFGKSEGGNFTRLYNSLKKGTFFYPGRKDTIKAAVYVKDVARILYETSIKCSSGVVTYNLSYYPAPTIEEICSTMAEVTNVKKPKLVIPGRVLKILAAFIYYLGLIFGKKINGIHPDRVKKLMLSTNISGKKLDQSQFKIEYSLKSAIEDWFNDCDKTGLC